MENLVLVPASPGQTHRALLNRFNPGGPITQEQHIERARVLGSLDYARGKQIYWVLVPADNQHTEDFLSSVGTIERKVLVQRAQPPPLSSGAGLEDKEQEPAYAPHLENAFSITHVHTPTDNRKQGYASRMMSLLHSKIGQHVGLEDYNLEGPRKGILSFLYSGVGDFYSRCGPPGWQVQTSTETYWDTSAVLEDLSNEPLTATAEYITESAFKEVAEGDANLFREELALRAKEGKPRAFVVLPTGEEFTWLVARSKFYGNILSSLPLPEVWGARVISSAGVPTSDFAIWFFDYPKKELHFLRLRCSSVASLKVILHAAAKAAQEQECKRFLAWQVDEDLLNEFPQRNRIHQVKKRNLSSVAWYGTAECPQWIANEKYGWC